MAEGILYAATTVAVAVAAITTGMGTSTGHRSILLISSGLVFSLSLVKLWTRRGKSGNTWILFMAVGIASAVFLAVRFI